MQLMQIMIFFVFDAGLKYGSDKTPKVYNVGDSVIYNSADYS